MLAVTCVALLVAVVRGFENAARFRTTVAQQRAGLAAYSAAAFDFGVFHRNAAGPSFDEQNLRRDGVNIIVAVPPGLSTTADKSRAWLSTTVEAFRRMHPSGWAVVVTAADTGQEHADFARERVHVVRISDPHAFRVESGIVLLPALLMLDGQQQLTGAAFGELDPEVLSDSLTDSPKRPVKFEVTKNAQRWN